MNKSVIHYLGHPKTCSSDDLFEFPEFFLAGDPKREMIERRWAFHRNPRVLLNSGFHLGPFKKRDQVALGNFKKIEAIARSAQGCHKAHPKHIAPKPYSRVHILGRQRDVVHSSKPCQKLLLCNCCSGCRSR